MYRPLSLGLVLASCFLECLRAGVGTVAGKAKLAHVRNSILSLRTQTSIDTDFILGLANSDIRSDSSRIGCLMKSIGIFHPKVSYASTGRNRIVKSSLICWRCLRDRLGVASGLGSSGTRI